MSNIPILDYAIYELQYYIYMYCGVSDYINVSISNGTDTIQQIFDLSNIGVQKIWQNKTMRFEAGLFNSINLKVTFARTSSITNVMGYFGFDNIVIRKVENIELSTRVLTTTTTITNTLNNATTTSTSVNTTTPISYQKIYYCDFDFDFEVCPHYSSSNISVIQYEELDYSDSYYVITDVSSISK